MGCINCGVDSAPAPNLWGIVPDSNQPTLQQDDECSEGYLARAGNPSCDQAGASPIETDPNVPAKIATISIATRCDLSIDTTMSSTKPALANQTWQFLNDSNAAFTVSGVTFGSNGHITGVFPAEGKHQFKAVLSVSGTEIDAKPFTVVVAKCNPGMDIKFIHPLPGSVMTSKCGNRVHPVTGVLKAHKGCDFAYGDRHLGKVGASADGEIIFAGVQNGYGNIVMIGHTNAQGKRMCITKYAHLSSICVTVGQKVSAGDNIGVEGNTGIGTGAHLHFEIRSGCGQMDQVFDPMVYLSGQVLSVDKIGTLSDGSADPGTVGSGATTSTQNNGAVKLSPAKVDAACSGYQTNMNPPTAGSPGGDAVQSPTDLAKLTPSPPGGCRPSPYAAPTVQQVIDRISAVCDADSSLDAEDKKFILFVAKIESRYDPYAKNPTSSATGLYQFLDVLANKYFPIIGSTATCENRCNVELATRAMIEFFKREIRKYYNDWVSSGRTMIAGKSVTSTAHSLRYPSLTKGCWCYGLIHHDGAGNAKNGIDRQGVEYYMRKLNAA